MASVASVSERPVATSSAVSMSLYVWRAPVTTDADVAARLLNLDDESVFEPSDRSCRFFEVLLERYPSPDVLTDRELEDGVTPWDDGPGGVRATRLPQPGGHATRTSTRSSYSPGAPGRDALVAARPVLGHGDRKRAADESPSRENAIRDLGTAIRFGRHPEPVREPPDQPQPQAPSALRVIECSAETASCVADGQDHLVVLDLDQDLDDAGTVGISVHRRVGERLAHAEPDRVDDHRRRHRVDSGGRRLSRRSEPTAEGLTVSVSVRAVVGNRASREIVSATSRAQTSSSLATFPKARRKAP
jgi:hypothetical protein